MSDDAKINFWLSWYGDLPMSEFELHSPWWISGYDADDRPVICAAVQATSEDAAIDYVLQSYDKPPAKVQWRFVEERPADWSPFNGRFEQAKWMTWPPVLNAADLARRLEKAARP